MSSGAVCAGNPCGTLNGSDGSSETQCPDEIAFLDEFLGKYTTLAIVSVPKPTERKRALSLRVAGTKAKRGRNCYAANVMHLWLTTAEKILE